MHRENLPRKLWKYTHINYSYFLFLQNWTAVYVVILGNVSAFNDQEVGFVC